MEYVWQVVWNGHNGFEMPLASSSQSRFSKIFYKTRESAEAYVEKYSEAMAKIRLDERRLEDLEDGSDHWVGKEYSKVRWDEVDQEFLDTHEMLAVEETIYWIEPDHAFDHYGEMICKVIKHELLD